MIRTDPIGDRYRRSIKSSRTFSDAVYTQAGVPYPLRAQKQFGEFIRQVGGYEMPVSGVRAIVDALDIPAPPAIGDTILFVHVAETYKVREFRVIGDGFLEIQLDL
jgi:hypothetical protein